MEKILKTALEIYKEYQPVDAPTVEDWQIKAMIEYAKQAIDKTVDDIDFLHHRDYIQKYNIDAQDDERENDFTSFIPCIPTDEDGIWYVDVRALWELKNQLK